MSRDEQRNLSTMTTIEQNTPAAPETTQASKAPKSRKPTLKSLQGLSAAKRETPKPETAQASEAPAPAPAPKAPVVANTPETNKAAIKAADRATQAAISLTRQNLIQAGKVTARTIARAQDTIAKAGLSLFWSFNAEGAQLANIQIDYEKDIAPITASVILEAYPDATKPMLATYRNKAKLFFLAGYRGVESEAITLNELCDVFRDELKKIGAIEAHGNDGSTGKGRKPRPGSAKDEKAAVEPTSSVSEYDGIAALGRAALAHREGAQANAAQVTTPTWAPGKTYSDKDRRNAALILSGTPAATVKIVKAFEVHREQIMKFIDQLIASVAS
jgi:hypothetical protein